MEDCKINFYCNLGEKFAKSRTVKSRDRKGSNATVSEAVQKKRCKNGRDFEKLVKDKFFENDFWVKKLETGREGTPFDLLTVRKGMAFGIECKHLEKMPEKFNIKQLRENQLLGLDNFSEYGESFVVFGNDDDIRIIAFEVLSSVREILVSVVPKLDSVLECACLERKRL